jgi:membrane protease YdiL (CAAX protease family)
MISWVIWLITGAVIKGTTYGMLASFSPTIAGIIVAAILNPTRSHASVKKRVIVFAVVLAICVAVTVQTAFMSGWQFPLYAIVTYGIMDLIIAYSISSYYHPIQGVAQMYQGLNQKGKKLIWLLIAFALPIAFQFGGALLNLGFGINLFGNLSVSLLLLFAMGFPNIFLFGGPVAEEPGWRGFATPQMQKYYNPLLVGIIIGFMWTVWHFPLYFTGDYPGGLEALLLRFVWNLPLGVLFAWVYNKSGGNLLAALLMHASNNLFVTMFSATNQNLYTCSAVMVAFTVIVVVATKFWKKPTQPLPTIQPTPVSA